MKRFAIVCCWCLPTVLYAQSLTLGDEVPSFTLETIAQPTADFQYSPESGKVLLLDFWATWCKPCVVGMPHLDSLQQAFPDQLQVVAVSDENADRLARFVRNKAHDFLFARDTGQVQALFPFRVIPHSVLIDQHGIVRAITEPRRMTKEVIQQVLAGQPIQLPLKQDNIQFDPSKDYFDADTTTQRAFEIQPYQPDLPSYTKTDRAGPFAHRRLSMHNVTVAKMYREAFQKSSFRLVYVMDPAKVAYENPENRFCLDIIVPKGEDLHRTLRQELLAALPIQGRLVQKEQELYRIIRTSDSLFLHEAEVREFHSARGDGFTSGGASLEDFCRYLENFGIFGQAVEDETGITGLYAIDFAFDPENPQSFRDALAAMGLTYEKVTRTIEVLELFEIVQY